MHRMDIIPATLKNPIPANRPAEYLTIRKTKGKQNTQQKISSFAVLNALTA